jgi:hypothetical protein
MPLTIVTTAPNTITITSIVVPVYNEENSIEASLDALQKAIHSKPD